MSESFVIGALNAYAIIWLCVGTAFFITAMGVRLCIREAMRRRN